MKNYANKIANKLVDLGARLRNNRLNDRARRRPLPPEVYRSRPKCAEQTRSDSKSVDLESLSTCVNDLLKEGYYHRTRYFITGK